MYIRRHDRIRLPNGKIISWNDKIITSLIKFYYHPFFTGEKFKLMPVCIHKLTSNQKIIHKSFNDKKRLSHDDAPIAVRNSNNPNRQPPGVLISYPILGFVYCSPYHGCLVFEMAVSLPGGHHQKNPNATTNLFDIIQFILRHDEVDPGFIKDCREVLVKVTISDQELKGIANDLHGFLDGYFVENDGETNEVNEENNNNTQQNQENHDTQNSKPPKFLNNPVFEKMVAKLIATNSAYALPFYTPVQNAIIEAIKSKTKNRKKSLRQRKDTYENEAYHSDEDDLGDEKVKTDVNQNNNEENLEMQEKEEKINVTSIVQSVLQSLENDHEDVNNLTSNFNGQGSQDYDNGNYYDDTTPLHRKTTQTTHSKNNTKNNTARKDEYSEAIILTPNQHELCVKLQDRVASLNGILTGVRGSGKSEMLIMKMSSLINRINENKLQTSMIVVGYIWPDISIRVDDLTCPQIFRKFQQRFRRRWVQNGRSWWQVAPKMGYDSAKLGQDSPRSGFFDHGQSSWAFWNVLWAISAEMAEV